MYRRVELPQVAQQAADQLRVIHHAAQDHEDRFEDVPGPGTRRRTLDSLALEKVLHRKVEQALLVAEKFVERPFRNPQLLCDVVHAHRLDALRDEHPHGLCYDPFFLSHGFRC